MTDYPSIADPTTSPQALQRAVGNLKEAVELLTGQRGNPAATSLPDQIAALAEQVNDLYGILVVGEFGLVPVTGASLNVVTTSALTYVQGPTDAFWPVYIDGEGSPEMSINGGTWGPFGFVKPNDTIQVRLTSANVAATTRTANLRFPGRSIPYLVTTT